MAKSIGAVRFKNGDLLYFLYNNFSSVALPKLFLTEQDASDAWDDPQADVFTLTHRPGGEEVELTTWYKEGRFEVSFRTRADREHMVLVGPLDLERSWDEFGDPEYGILPREDKA